MYINTVAQMNEKNTDIHLKAPESELCGHIISVEASHPKVYKPLNMLLGQLQG